MVQRTVGTVRPQGRGRARAGGGALACVARPKCRHGPRRVCRTWLQHCNTSTCDVAPCDCYRCNGAFAALQVQAAGVARGPSRIAGDVRLGARLTRAQR
jgi:hypothetical protein